MKIKVQELPVVETFKCSNGGTIRVRGKKLDTTIMARFLLGLPQINNKNADNNVNNKKPSF
ncbi:hypothetical protein CN930_28815 [Bacillus cereus]|nr:hypothetical protein CN930_28815 [Bacillus cereus]